MPAGWGGNKYFLVYRYLSKIIYLTVTLFDQWQLLPLEGLGKGRVIRKFREILIVQLVTHMMPRDKWRWRGEAGVDIFFMEFRKVKTFTQKAASFVS